MTVIDSIVDRLKKNSEYSSYHKSQTAVIGRVSLGGGQYLKKLTCANVCCCCFHFFFVIIIVHFCVLFCISCLLYDGKLKRARRQLNERGTAVVAFDFWYFFWHHGQQSAASTAIAVDYFAP